MDFSWQHLYEICEGILIIKYFVYNYEYNNGLKKMYKFPVLNIILLFIRV